MQVINLSKEQFSKLKLLNLPYDVFNTESKIFVYSSKNKWFYNKKVFKYFYTIRDTQFYNKIYTIKELIDKKDKINIEELVMPEALVKINNEIVGYIMPYIENSNLSVIINNPKIQIAKKVKLLQDIGILLEKLKKVRQYTDLKDFYLNDIHESNFILNHHTGHINAVDLDSCKISGNNIFPSRYLVLRNQLNKVHKYSKSRNDLEDIFQISENTELYCFIVMIFNLFYRDNIGRLSISEYYNYLEYLSSIGVNKEILDIFSTIYSSKDNVNPYEYLEELIPFYGKTYKQTYEKVRNKNI